MSFSFQYWKDYLSDPDIRSPGRRHVLAEIRKGCFALRHKDGTFIQASTNRIENRVLWGWDWHLLRSLGAWTSVSFAVEFRDYPEYSSDR